MTEIKLYIIMMCCRPTEVVYSPYQVRRIYYLSSRLVMGTIDILAHDYCEASISKLLNLVIDQFTLSIITSPP